MIQWEGKPISVSISTERLTRIEFHENLRSVFFSRSDIAVEKEERSLFVRALAPAVEDTLFAVAEEIRIRWPLSERQSEPGKFPCHLSSGSSLTVPGFLPIA